MTKEQLYESIGQLDDRILENSERQERKPQKLWKWLALAACFVLIVSLIARFPDSVHEPASDDLPAADMPVRDEPADDMPEAAPPADEPAADAPLDEPMDEPADMPDAAAAEFFYNDAEVWPVLMEDPADYDLETLREEDKAAVLPDGLDGECMAGYWDSGKLLDVIIEMETVVPDSELVVWMLRTSNDLRYVDAGEPVVSQCGDVEYTLYWGHYETDVGRRFMLTATAELNGVECAFEMYGPWDAMEQAKAEFEEILKAFAQDMPDVSVIKENNT